ncbi:MAG: zinc ribbon domain-containing protein [Anaerolineae bacterium]|nr:zinc ribbon domain-containing protein [Anaerolineae bacterium]
MTNSSSPRFCGQCGAPLHADALFCSMCGRAVPQSPPQQVSGQQQAPQQFQQPYSPPQQQQPQPSPRPAFAPPAEPILGIVPGLQRQSGFLGMKVESFNLIATPHRLVLAFIPQEMMNEAVNAARNEAKSEGKGWLGQVAAQMGWLNVICRQYQTMSVEAILAQTPGSFFIALPTIRRVRLDDVYDQDNNHAGTELVVETTGGKHKFKLVGMSARDARNVLKQVLGGIVK